MLNKKLALDQRGAHRMRIPAISLLLIFVSHSSAFARTSLPGEGVRFHYRVHKLGSNIIKASLSIEQDGPLYLVKAVVDTTRVTRLFFRMHNRFTSYVKEEGLEPWRY